MRSIYSRLFTFFFGIPPIIVCILLLPQAGHLALNILLITFTVIGALEISGLLNQKGIPVDLSLAITCAGILPLSVYLEIIAVTSVETTLIAVVVVFHAILIRQLFGIKLAGTQGILMRTCADMLVVVYPGFLMAYVAKILTLPSPSTMFLIFIIIVFVNDTGAYVFGMLFGRRNAGIFPLSPKKSVAGLIAGMGLSVGAALVFFRFYPDQFGHSLLFSIIVGLCMSIVAVLGDLVESAFKRSAGTKDSGHVIPGRGGILDSIDSVIFCGPAFFLLMNYVVKVV